MKALFIFFILLSLTVLPSGVLAQESDMETDSEMTSTESAMQKNDYTLPYPGMLPDNPLYSLKTARDQVIGFLISDPIKKAEFNLLQADKRLQAAVMLIEKDDSKYLLAQTTISKGENYFEEAILKMEQAEKLGKDISTIESKLENSNLTHRAIVAELLKKAPQAEKEGYAQLLKRIEQFAADLEIVES